MKKYLIILVCVLLCGCVSTKKVRNQSLEVAKFDIEKFNGNYVNKANTDCVSNLFYKLHPENILHKNKKEPTDNAIINLKFNGKKRLTVTTIDNNGIFKKTKLKGRVKNSYFSVRRKLLIIPFYCFFHRHQEDKILLGNDKNGNLILKNGYHDVSIIILIGSESNGISQSQFKKLK